jgi:hypothetical protein
LHIAHLYAQSLESLTPANITGDSFAVKINALRDKMIDAEDYEQIRSLDKYMDQLPKYKFTDITLIRKAYCYHAYAYSRKLGDYKSAEKYYQLAADQLKSDDYRDTWIASIEQPLANIYTRQGEYDKSIALLHFVIHAAMVQNDPEMASGAYSDLGIVYSDLGDFEKSTEAYTLGEAAAKRASSVSDLLLNKLNKAELLINLLRFVEAKGELALIRQSINLLENRQQEYQLEYLKLLAQLYSDSGNHSEALKILKECRILISQMSNPDAYKRESAKFYYQTARENLALGNSNQAFEDIVSGLKLLNPKITRQNLLSTRVVYAENTFDQLYTCLGDYYTQKSTNSPDSKWIDLAITSYERALAARKLLYDTYILDGSKLKNLARSRSITNNILDLLYRKERLAGKNQDMKQIEYLFEISGGRMLTESIIKRKKFDQLTSSQRSKIIQIQKNISQLNRDESSESSRALVRLKETQDSILNRISDKDYFTEYSGRYIHFVSTGKSVYSMDNFSGKLSFKFLGSSVLLDSLNAHFLQALRIPGSNFKQTGTQIYKMLFGSFRRLPDKFSIITSDQLAQLPFGALTDQQGDYLIRHHVISYRSNLLCPKNSKQNSGIYAVVPDYTSPGSPTNAIRGNLFPLLYANAEVEGVKTEFPELKVEKVVNRNTLRQVIEQSDIMHYVGHAQSGTNMGRLLISRQEDNFISGKEISSWYSGLRLAVLSACETGLGKLYEGEGMMSLARSFLESGTQNVIYSLWAVNDQSTARLMKLFYQEYAVSNDAAGALREAKLEYLRTAPPEARHPYYWAGFVLMTNSEEHTGGHFWVYLVSGVLLIIIIFITYKKFRK